MATFNNIEDLENAIKQKIKISLDNSKEYIYNKVNTNLQTFYDEYDPKCYIRTGTIKQSLVKEDDIGDVGFRPGFDVGFKVGFDSDKINYETEGVEWKQGFKLNATGDPYITLNAVMRGSHGGVRGIKGTRVWEESRADIGDIRNLVRLQMIKAGLPLE